MIGFIILGISTTVCIGLLIYVVIKIIMEDVETHMIARRRTRRSRLERSVQMRIELIMELTERRRVQPVRELEMTPINHIIVINPGNQITLGSEYVYKKEGE